MALEKGEGASLRPRAPTGGAFQETRMASLADEVGLDESRFRGGVAGQRGGGHEGIVDGVDEQGGPAYLRQVGARARARPVVPLVLEAVKGRRHQPVVLGKGPRTERGGQIEEPIVEALLLPELGLEGPQEARRVHGAVQSAVEGAGARREIE